MAPQHKPVSDILKKHAWEQTKALLLELGRRGFSLAIKRDLSQLEDRFETPIRIKGFYIYNRIDTVESETIYAKTFETYFYATPDPNLIHPPEDFITVRVRDYHGLLYAAAIKEIFDSPPDGARTI